jgi:hypothetical protein
MQVTEENLTPKQERALVALLDCGEIKRAAKVATMQQGERTDLPQICGRLSQPKAAELLNVSKRSVQHAQKVKGCHQDCPVLKTGRDRLRAETSAQRTCASVAGIRRVGFQ